MIVRKTIAGAKCKLGVYQSQYKRLGKSGNSVILMYHRIIAPESFAEHVEPGMYVRPETFSMHCSVLRHYFDVVPLSEIISSKDILSSKPRCAITFDDGWADFYQNAFPILKAAHLPSTVYLPTNFIGTDMQFWTDTCAAILKKICHEKPELPYQGTSPVIREILQIKGDYISCVDSVIKMLKPYSTGEIKKILDELAQYAGCSHTSLQTFMTWNEVKTCLDSGLVAFGSHTVNHLILTAESRQTVHDELRISKEKLIKEQVADPSDISFCYPNGGYSQEITQMVKMAGYSSAVTTKTGWNSAMSERYNLRRIGMHQDMTSTRSLIMARLAMQ
ncbi:MAG: polysaccharide deacetylase family protein [Fibrobacter sp.]|nr:polysaccharide deacetylase family protein [Fibrobacter sp.]